MKEELEVILREFLDDVDWVLENPSKGIEDKEYFDRPIKEALTSIINLVDKEAEDCELPCTCKAQERGAYMHKLTCAENHNITVRNLRAKLKGVNNGLV